MDKNISKDDIIEYWLSLYPEFKDEKELDYYFTKNLNGNIDEMVNKYLSEYSIKNEKKFFSLDNYYNYHFFSFYKKIIENNIFFLLEIISRSELILDKRIFTNNIIGQLCEKLYFICERTLVLEMNICKENGELKGDNAEEKLKYYEKNILENKEYLEYLYKDYPELVKLLEITTSNFLKNICEIIIFTENNIDSIKNISNSKDSLGKLKFIKIGIGDTHCLGKSVAKISFENDDIIYKPRSLQTDIEFQKILKEINNNKVLPNCTLRTVNMFTLKEMGWMEYIEYTDCKNEKEVKEYFKKIGSLLCILYMLNAVDIHFENIIANGNDPVIIDLESLFHTNLETDLLEPNSGQNKARDFLQKSVSSIGILPSKLTIGKENNKRSIVVGGLDLVEGQYSFLKSNILDKSNLDKIKIKMKEFKIEEKQNVPMIRGEKINSYDYLNYIINGFELTYMWVINNKRSFMRNVIRNFKDTKNRIIIKPTFLYSNILSISNHPDFLHSNINRDILLARIGLVLNQYNLIKNELIALRLGDIPIFKCNFNETNLLDGYNNITNVKLKETPRQAFINKINNLNLLDLEMQKEQIYNSYFSKNADDEMSILNYTIPERFLTIEEALSTSIEIGEYLIEHRFSGTNILGNNDCYWIGSSIHKMENNDWSYQICELDLYDGNCGISLFLLYLWKLTKEKKFLKVALEAIEPIKAQLKYGINNKIKFSGAFKGISGYFYTLSKFSKILMNEEYDLLISENLCILEEFIEKDNINDIIGGNIGMLSVLLSIYENILDNKLKENIISICYKCFNKLKLNITQDFDNYSINKEILKYSGFSHGVSGLVAYLYKFYKITKDEDVINLFNKLIAYERDEFKNDEILDWYINNENDELACGWCHGSPGILLSKVILKDLGYTDQYIDKEIDIALRNVLKSGIGNNISYCHGDLGNIDILLYYSKVCKDKKTENLTLQILSSLYQNNLKDGWNNKNKSYSRYKGLLIGLSGIGFFLLNKVSSSSIDHFLWIE